MSAYLYLTLKTTHLFFVIGWMAALFYLPRIFVHFQHGKDKNADVEYLKTMASKLFSFMTLIGLLAVGTGVWLGIESPNLPFKMKWLHIKLLFVFLLLIYHGSCYYFLVQMKKDLLKQTHVFFRFYNEVPTFIMIPILYYVVFKHVAIFAG